MSYPYHFQIYEQLGKLKLSNNAQLSAVTAYIEGKYDEHRARLDGLNSQRGGALRAKDFDLANRITKEIDDMAATHPLDVIPKEEINGIAQAIKDAIKLIYGRGDKQ